MSKRSTKIDATAAVKEYIDKDDWRINANANTGYSHAGLINNLAGKAIANYWLDEIYSKEEGDAHRNGDYHIHDLDQLGPYCCGSDFQKLLDEGFNGVNGRVGSRPPKHFREALYQLANYFGILQAEWAGAQAVSSFDTYLAPYVFFDMQCGGLSEDGVKKAIRNFIYNLNVPSRWGQCVPETYKCLKADGTWANYKDLKVGDEIYVIDMETGRLKKDTITHLNVFDSPAKLHHYSNNHGFNFFVTPNHRVINKTGSNPWKISESADLIKLKGPIGIPVSQFGPIPREEYMANEYDISDALLELTAFIMTDGCIAKQEGHAPRLEWCKSVKRYGIGRFEELCSDLGIAYSKRIREHGFEGTCTANYKLSKCEATDKIIELLDGDKHKVPAFIKLLSPRQANIILDTWVLTDGHFDGSHWKMQADTHEIQEMLAYLTLITGKSTSLREVVIGDNKKATIYTVIHKRGTRSCMIQEVDTEYNKVWCPTTNTGTFVCMTDEGYVFLTGNSPFTNVTIDWTVPQMMRNMMPTRGGDNYFLSIKKEWEKTGKLDQEKWDNLCSEALSRIGVDDEGKKAWKELCAKGERDADEVFYNLSYAVFQKEMNIINRCFYEVLNEGDMLGIPFTFPIPTINITEDFDWEGENVDLLFENTAKYGCSYFQNFIGSQYMKDENGNKVRNPDAYSPNDVRSMCPLTLDTVIPTNNGMKMLKDLNEQHDRVFYNDQWYSFKKITNIEEQDVYLIDLDGMTSDGRPMQIKAGANHIQPVFNYQTGSYVKKFIKHLCSNDYLPVERFVDNVRGCDIAPDFRSVVRGGDGLFYVPIRSIQKIQRQPLMCIEVNNEEHNFTLGSCIITSNCRLQLDKKQLRKKGGGLFGSDSKTGSVGVVTINCARLGYLYREDEKALYEALDRLLEMAKSTLEKKRKVVTELLERGLYPYTRRYIGSYDTFFSTIGVNGMNEMVRNFTNNKYDITSEFGQEFAKKMLLYIRERLVIFQEETNNLYNLEATPAEGTMRRFAHLDKAKYPGILQAGTNEMPFYTNSCQLPVDFTSDAFTALDLQDDLQCMFTGGVVFHLYMRERVSSADACKRLVKSVLSNYRLPYISITPTFSICPKHGRLEGEQEYCPLCDQEIINAHAKEVDTNL